MIHIFLKLLVESFVMLQTLLDLLKWYWIRVLIVFLCQLWSKYDSDDLNNCVDSPPFLPAPVGRKKGGTGTNTEQHSIYPVTVVKRGKKGPTGYHVQYAEQSPMWFYGQI